MSLIQEAVCNRSRLIFSQSCSIFSRQNRLRRTNSLCASTTNIPSFAATFLAGFRWMPHIEGKGSWSRATWENRVGGGKLGEQRFKLPWHWKCCKFPQNCWLTMFPAPICFQCIPRCFLEVDSPLNKDYVRCPLRISTRRLWAPTNISPSFKWFLTPIPLCVMWMLVCGR